MKVRIEPHVAKSNDYYSNQGLIFYHNEKNAALLGAGSAEVLLDF